MTKEQFLNKWPYLNDTRDTINPYFIDDLEAVIAHEIAKVQEAKLEEPKGNCTTFDMSRLVDQVQPDKQTAKPFDKDRFEAMFRAVVASGVQQNFECFKIDTTYFLQQLDAFYTEKEKGGENG